MNDHAAAPVLDGEASVDAAGDAPDLSLNPHLGHLDPDQAEAGKDEAGKEKGEAKVSDSPSDGEDNAVKEPDDRESLREKKVEELAYENRQLKRQLQQRAKVQEESKPEPLKTLKDFGYDEQAFNEYIVDRATERAAARMERRYEATRADDEAQRRADTFAAREAAFEAENPGFTERLHSEDLRITPEMASFIMDPDNEVGLHVGDYLSRNPKEAARIASLSEVAQARAMVTLESKVSSELAKVKAEKSKASKAPEPPANPVDGTDPGVSRDPSDPKTADKMSDDEWFKARERQLEKRRKR